MSKIKELTGQRFGSLIVIVRSFPNTGTQANWKCVCDCGNEKVIIGKNLRNGLTKSCGCLSARLTGERSRTHGKSRTSTYNIWSVLHQRCNNPKCKEYPSYGQRGIKICKEWEDSFDNFLKDMGERPAGHSLDRINNNDGYYKENCRCN